ncbi:EAL domain-containing protein [Arsenicitalea aurantiaca]|uniref:EAL domain-containing protein n=2 Tax=Arsenicitalea aurantiaca TaxID=1783274 RepID=A0A433X5Q4_9HYPH|nr:EAL domain-containing protein [Arsenicitalea aurantiaca]
MDIAFVSEFAAGRRYFRYVDTRVDEPRIAVGQSMPLSEGYCIRVVEGSLPELITDTARHPEARALPETSQFRIGAHMGVPIRLASGRIYGSFCCISHAPKPGLDDRDLAMLRAFADLTALQIERESELADSRATKIERVRGAISRGLIGTVYQPIYALAENRLTGFECLSRFGGEDARTPDLWFAEAAEVGLGPELEMAAIRIALRALPALPPDLRLALNVSPETILTGALSELLAGAPAERIELEITEHAHVADYDALSRELGPLRARGLQLAVDDAGAGYASLRHILLLAPDLIKLDVSLTRDIDTDPARRAMASALIGFAGETRSAIIAEGVETPGELEALRALGVGRAQGYHLGRPMALTDAVALAKTRR